MVTNALMSHVNQQDRSLASRTISRVRGLFLERTHDASPDCVDLLA